MGLNDTCYYYTTEFTDRRSSIVVVIKESLSVACHVDLEPDHKLERTTHRLDAGGGVKCQIITPTSWADAGVGGKGARSLRVGGEVPAHLPSGNGHDRREDTTSTPTRSVQENSNVRFNIDWEVA